MKNLAYLTLILCLLPIASHAQQPQYSGGIKYTTVRSKQPQGDSQKSLYNRQAPPPAESQPDSALPKAPEEDLEAAKASKTPQDSVWEKYKELARGKTKQEDENEPVKPSKPQSPSKKSAKLGQKETPKPSGMAAIIADYQRNKSRRSQMHRVRVAKPKKPEAETPAVDTPSVEAPNVEKDN